MKQYIWYHPSYVQKTSKDILQGQINNARTNHYIVLEENELDKVYAWDHLTIVGGTLSSQSDNNTGLYIEKEDAGQCVKRLQQAGLKVSPKILSLECCNAGISEGIAQQLSNHLFFKNSLIEANVAMLGRNPGLVKWSGFTVDNFGRSASSLSDQSWVFLLAGKAIGAYSHGHYKLENILQQVLPVDFHTQFISHYNPGFFWGRVGRYCSSGEKITFEQATIFADETPNSATAIALEKVMQEASVLRM